MFDRSIPAVTIAMAMLTSMAIGGAMASPGQLHDESSGTEASVHTGAHVAFDTKADAVTNYTVEGTQLLGSVAVESSSSAEQRGALGLGGDLSSVTSLDAGALSVDTESDTRVEIEAEGGSTIEAHDSQHGHLVVHAGEDGTVVAANLSGDAEAEQESESRVVVTKDDGTAGTVIVIGEGEVTINEDGNIVADLEQNSSLTYRQYEGERSDEDEAREQMIANGTTAAEVYVTTAAEGSSEVAADVVQYAEDTTVEVVTNSENRIEMTAERTESEGRVIVTTVSEAAFEGADEIEVTVDGEAAVEASSMSELDAAASGGDSSAYMVRSASTAEASSEVLVAVNHFSERDVILHGPGDETDTDSSADSDDTSTDSGEKTDSDDSSPDTEDSTAAGDGSSDPMPGFGVLLALIALSASGAMAVWSRATR